MWAFHVHVHILAHVIMLLWVWTYASAFKTFELKLIIGTIRNIQGHAWQYSKQTNNEAFSREFHSKVDIYTQNTKESETDFIVNLKMIFISRWNRTRTFYHIYTNLAPQLPTGVPWRVLTDVFQQKQCPKLIVSSTGTYCGRYDSFGYVATGVTVIYIETWRAQ